MTLVYSPGPEDSPQIISKYTHVAYKIVLEEFIEEAKKEARDVPIEEISKDLRYHFAVLNSESIMDTLKSLVKLSVATCLVLMRFNSSIFDNPDDIRWDFEELHLYNDEVPEEWQLDSRLYYPYVVILPPVKVLGIHGSAVNMLMIRISRATRLDTLMSLYVPGLVPNGHPYGDRYGSTYSSRIRRRSPYRVPRRTIEYREGFIRIIDLDPRGLISLISDLPGSSEWVSLENSSEEGCDALARMVKEDQGPHSLNVFDVNGVSIHPMPYMPDLLELNFTDNLCSDRLLNLNLIPNVEILTLIYNQPCFFSKHLADLSNLRILNLMGPLRADLMSYEDVFNRLPKLESLRTQEFIPEIYQINQLDSLILSDPPIETLEGIRRSLFKNPPEQLIVELSEPSLEYLQRASQSVIAEEYPEILNMLIKRMFEMTSS